MSSKHAVLARDLSEKDGPTISLLTSMLPPGTYGAENLHAWLNWENKFLDMKSQPKLCPVTLGA